MTHQFTSSEKRRIFELVEKMIGTSKVANDRAEIFLNNIERRIYLSKKKNLEEYLRFASQNSQEHGYLISSLTIHTTYWFREMGHFDYIKKYFSLDVQMTRLRALSLGCSTGEEVYSLALVLEQVRKNLPVFDYKILGIDIDPVSIATAEKAIYNSKDLGKIPIEYHNSMLIGSGKTEGLMTLSKDIRERVKFQVGSALHLSEIPGEFELGLCRNMLIYFDEASVNRIVENLASRIVPQGLFMLGHSENFNNEIGFEKMGGSIFKNSSDVNSLPKAKTPLLKEKAVQSIQKVNFIMMPFQGADEHRVKVLLSQASFEFKMTSSREEAQHLLKNDKARVFICSFSKEICKDDLDFLTELKNKHPDLAVFAIYEEDIINENLLELKRVADEIVSLQKLNRNKDQYLSRLSTIIEVKKVGGQFSKLPVAVVDDDEFVSEAFANILSDVGFTVKVFSSGPDFLNYLRDHPVQAVVSDFKMPYMNGDELCEEVIKIRKGVPFILVSGVIRDIGKTKAYKVLSKPISPETLIQVVQNALLDRYSGRLLELDPVKTKKAELVVIGGSTGAPPVFQRILSQLPRPFPPTVVVQHIPPKFQESFAKDLAASSGLRLKIIDSKVELERDTLYLADVDKHIVIKKEGDKILVDCDESEPYKGLRPCVHKLFESTAQLGNKNVLGILLTGMGDDGSIALGSMRRAGQYTVAQDLSSSTVFGMPKVAIDNDNVDYIGSVDKIHEILRKLNAA